MKARRQRRTVPLPPLHLRIILFIGLMCIFAIQAPFVVWRNVVRGR